MCGRSYPRMWEKWGLGMMRHASDTESAASATPQIMSTVVIAGSLLLTLLLISAVFVFAGPAAAVASTPAALWLGPDGQPLPFTTHAEVVEFLRTAEVVSSTVVETGSTLPDKLLLEKDGVQLHAIFRTFFRFQDHTTDPQTGQFIAGRVKDSAMFEAAAYELAQLLDFPLVPPTVRRTINNREGTLQLWIESAMTETKRRDLGIEPPNPHWWSGIMQSLRTWDNLIFNADRNTGNFLIDPNWGIWFVDHTRAFQTRRDLRRLDLITFCERHLWERLQAVTDEEINAHLSLYLDGQEIGALLARREQIVKRIEELIQENGEDAVIFSYSHDISDWTRPGPR